MPSYNDIDKSKWEEYTDILTDSLWIIPKRDNSGAHTGKYHGNFVPQIPHQLFSRYVKKGEWVLDPFMGSGTTLIEAQRMGINSIGIDLQDNVVEEALARINTEPTNNCQTVAYCRNSKTIDMNSLLKYHNIEKLQFIIYHPPYWDIIKFSQNVEDISNTSSLESFLNEFGKVIDNTLPHLQKGRYCAVVIGDKYANSQVIPLGFHCMNLFTERGLLLKAIIVKNFGDTKGKSNKQGIWRYRAIASDFYIFKHEYIFIFKKTKQ